MHRYPAATPHRARDFLTSYPVLLLLALWLLTTVAAVLLRGDIFRSSPLILGSLPGDRFPSLQGLSALYLWTVLVCAPLGVVTFVAAAPIADRLRRDPAARLRLRTALRWAGLVTATGLLAFPVVKLVLANLAGFVLAVPGAVFAIWFLHGTQRNRRIPLWRSLLAFGWGGTVAITAGHLMLSLLHASVVSMALPAADLAGPGQPPLMVLSAPIWEEFAKGVGVLIVFHLCRPWFDGVVPGAVIGMLVGAGFNFMETVRYAMTSYDLAISQVWVRQWVGGLLFGHVLYSGLFGASVGLASKLGGKAIRAACLAAGFGMAVLGHFLWNHAALNNRLPWSSPDPAAELIVLMPLNQVTINGVFCVVLAAAVWWELRREARAIGATLPVEAATGLGAITPAEVTVLANPARRLGRRLLAGRALGPAGYFRAGRLQAAQLDLAMERWRLAHERGRISPESERALRDRIWRLRQGLAAPGRVVA